MNWRVFFSKVIVHVLTWNNACRLQVATAFQLKFFIRRINCWSRRFFLSRRYSHHNCNLLLQVMALNVWCKTIKVQVMFFGFLFVWNSWLEMTSMRCGQIRFVFNFCCWISSADKINCFVADCGMKWTHNESRSLMSQMTFRS